jgi:hypothetical protein
MGQLVWYSRPEPRENAIGVLAPGDGDGRGADGIFQNQVPADDPRRELSHRRVGIGIRAAGYGDHRGELGVTEAGQGAADARHDEGQDRPSTGRWIWS